jgi:hypothetical protein
MPASPGGAGVLVRHAADVLDEVGRDLADAVAAQGETIDEAAEAGFDAGALHLGDRRIVLRLGAVGLGMRQMSCACTRGTPCPSSRARAISQSGCGWLPTTVLGIMWVG